MKIDDIYKKWIFSIDLVKTRVTRFPSYILLCGGPVSGNGKKVGSCRDTFFRYIRRSKRIFRDKVVLAEQIFRYFEHSAYTDLLIFERDLAELSALTVIFSESPGSIAELGSFAVLKPVQERLLVVVHEEDAYKESFIWRGPMLYLKELAKGNGKEDPISVYNWPRKSGSNYAFPDAKDLAETITKMLSKIPKTQSFNKNRLGHIMILMLDLLKVIQIATIDEIVSYLDLLGIQIQHDRKNVERHLSLLLSLELAICKPYRNNIYYLSAEDPPWLSWAFTKMATTRDIDRWKAMFADYYVRKQDQKSRALRSHLKGLSGR